MLSIGLSHRIRAVISPKATSDLSTSLIHPSLESLRRNLPARGEFVLNRRLTRPKAVIRVRLRRVLSEARDMGGRSIAEYTTAEFNALRQDRSLDLEDLVFLGREGVRLRWWWQRWHGNDRREGTAKQLIALAVATDGRIPRSLPARISILDKLNLLTDYEIGHTYNGLSHLVEPMPEQTQKKLEGFLLSLSDG